MYHVCSFEPGLWTVGTGTPGVDWEPVGDFGRQDLAQAEAEWRNSPHIYKLLEKAGCQIDELIERLDRLEKRVALSARVDNENNPDWQGY